MSKDYTSFSSAAKSRFRDMAKELGYEQITGIVYVKERDGWYEIFDLQASSYGNPFFYFNYGVILPEVFPLSRDELKVSGMSLSARLEYQGRRPSFPAGTKAEIESSAKEALKAYKEEVVPSFEKLNLSIVQKGIEDYLYGSSLHPIKSIVSDLG